MQIKKHSIRTVEFYVTRDGSIIRRDLAGKYLNCWIYRNFDGAYIDHSEDLDELIQLHQLRLVR